MSWIDSCLPPPPPPLYSSSFNGDFGFSCPPFQLLSSSLSPSSTSSVDDISFVQQDFCAAAYNSFNLPLSNHCLDDMSCGHGGGYDALMQAVAAAKSSTIVAATKQEREGEAAIAADMYKDLDDVLDLILEESEATSALKSTSDSSAGVDWVEEFMSASKNEVDRRIGEAHGEPGVCKGATCTEKPQKRNWLQMMEADEVAPARAPSRDYARPGAISWVGLTLGDIESALATHGSCSSSPPSCSILPCVKRLITGPSLEDLLRHDFSSSPGDALALEEDDKLVAWRKLQKRNQSEPRYTFKFRCGEDATNDGYRWRKYGQKSIKNSPYPRSYYRCSSGKCRVKKQVERSIEDAGLVLVTYEGIHLHHRPNPVAIKLAPSVLYKERASRDQHEEEEEGRHQLAAEGKQDNSNSSDKHQHPKPSCNKRKRQPPPPPPPTCLSPSSSHLHTCESPSAALTIPFTTTTAASSSSCSSSHPSTPPYSSTNTYACTAIGDAARTAACSGAGADASCSASAFSSDSSVATASSPLPHHPPLPFMTLHSSP